jgi:hypothetical protein
MEFWLIVWAVRYWIVAGGLLVAINAGWEMFDARTERYVAGAAQYLSRYSATGRHRLRVGQDGVATRPTSAQAQEPVPRLLAWA